jgi:hypothetical protein
MAKKLVIFRRSGGISVYPGKLITNSKPCPQYPKIRVAKESEGKSLYLRTTYHIGQARISWCLKRYHDMKVSPEGEYGVLKRYGLSTMWSLDFHFGSTPFIPIVP